MNTSVEQTVINFLGVFLCRNTHKKNTKLDLLHKYTRIPDEKKWKESRKNPIRSVTTHRVIYQNLTHTEVETKKVRIRNTMYHML